MTYQANRIRLTPYSALPLPRRLPAVFLKTFLPAAAALLLVSLSASAQLMPGRPLGGFSAQKDGGGTVKLGSQGEPCIIAFFIPVGVKDAAQMIALQDLLSKKTYKGFSAFAVTRGLNDEDRSKARKYLSDNGIGIPLVFDSKENELARRLNATVFPAFYIIDSKGVYRASATSITEPANRLSFKDFLDYTIAGKEIPFVDLVPRSQNSDAQKKLLGKKAPDFSLPSLAGRRTSLSDYRGRKNVVLIFWSPQCGHCQHELPKVQSYYVSRRMDFDFEVLAITGAGDDKGKSASDFARSKMLTFPILLDDKWETSSSYGVKGVPLTIFINKDGVIVDFLSGSSQYFNELYDSIFEDPARLGRAVSKK